MIQFLAWMEMKAVVFIWVTTCFKYQKFYKPTNWPYENITFRKPEMLWWSTTHIDLVGNWTVLFNNSDETKL